MCQFNKSLPISIHENILLCSISKALLFYWVALYEITNSQPTKPSVSCGSTKRIQPAIDLELIFIFDVR